MSHIIARLWYREVIPLSTDSIEVERGPLSQLTTLPARRLDIHFGKFDLVDFFDLDSVANDSHMQFLNWTVANNGAFDYAADVRGYTYGLILDLEDRIVGIPLRRGDAVQASPTGSTFKRICRTRIPRIMNSSSDRR